MDGPRSTSDNMEIRLTLFVEAHRPFEIHPAGSVLPAPGLLLKAGIYSRGGSRTALHRLPSQFRRWAEIVHRTARAIRFSRVADPPAVEHQAVGKAGPLLRRQELHQIPLDLFRVLFARQAETARHALAVGVDDDAGHAEGVAENHVGGFAPHARKAG